MAKKKPGVNTDGGESAAYPEGTPVDDEGRPLEEATMTPDEAVKLGVYDIESARVKKQHDDTMARKAAGDTEVRWNADPSIRFLECVKFTPGAECVVMQIEPVKDFNIDPQPVTILKTQEDVIKYVRDTHWDGGKCAYQWTLRTYTNPRHAQGVFNFKADPQWKKPGTEVEQMSQKGQPPWGQQPQQGWGGPPPGYGGYPQQGWGGPPPGYGGYPVVQVVQPAQPMYPQQPQYAPQTQQPPQQYAPAPQP
jgi:hypothetical protein